MRLDIQHANQVEFPVDVRLEQRFGFAAVQLISPFSRGPDDRGSPTEAGDANRSAVSRRLRPRARRDITVPIGAPVTSPICLYDIPSSSRSTSTSRYSAGS